MLLSRLSTITCQEFDVLTYIVLLLNLRFLVFDQGDSLIPGIPETLERLRKAGKKMFFVTNNSTKSRAGYKKKFDSLGLDIPAEEIFSSKCDNFV